MLGSSQVFEVQQTPLGTSGIWELLLCAPHVPHVPRMSHKSELYHLQT